MGGPPLNTIRTVKITGTGFHIPPNKVTNFDLEKMMDTSDEWIQKRSGIQSRYHADKETCTSDLALEASLAALRNAKLKATDIDLIITATLSPDHHFPGIGVKLQHKLGLETTPAMDVRNQCSGFIYGLNMAQMAVATGQYQRVLLVGAEIHSKLIDLTTRGRDIAVLFGDGAGAVILEPSPNPEAGILSCHLYSQGEFADRLWIERPGTTKARFMEEGDIAEGSHFPKMDGRYVFKHASTRIQETITKVAEHNKITIDDIDHFIFHQANIRINENVAKNLGIPGSKVHHNIQKYGNCSAASLPILLHECVQAGKIRPGQLICMAAFGSGFTWAGSLIRW